MSPDLHQLSGAYAVDALDADERSDFERHLAMCEACREEVAELSAAAHAHAALTEAEPPASLRASVLSGISQIRPLPPVLDTEERTADVTSAPPSPDPGPAPDPVEEQDRPRHGNVVPLFRRTATWVAAAAAAAVLAVGGAVVGVWTQSQPEQTAMQQVEQASDATSVTQRSGDVTATLAYSRQLDRSAVAVSGLPPAPSGKVYQLWYIGADGARSAGFITSEDGRGQAALEGDLGSAGQVGITVEPAGGSTQPTTDPVIAVKVA